MFDFIFKTARAALIDDISQELDIQISSDIVERILNAKHYETTKKAAGILHSMGQYEFFREFLTSNTIVVFIDIFFTIVFIVVIGLFSWQLAIVPAVAAIALVLVGYIGVKKLNDAMQRATASGSSRQYLLVETVNNIESIKSLRMEEQLLRKWGSLNRLQTASMSQAKKRSSMISNWASFVQSIAPVGIVVLGGILFDLGALTMGGLIAAVMLTGRGPCAHGAVGDHDGAISSRCKCNTGVEVFVGYGR